MSDKNRPGLLDGAKREDDIDYQRMLDTAVSFFLAGERCRPSLQFGRYPVHCVNAPTIVNYALSVEIVLKILVRFQGQCTRSHDLNELYQLLNEESKSNMSILSSYFRDVKNPYRDGDERVIPFLDWRYPYEHESLVGETDTLRRVFIVCHREVRRVLPELASVYERDWGSFDPDWNWAWREREIEEIEGKV